MPPLPSEHPDSESQAANLPSPPGKIPAESDGESAAAVPPQNSPRDSESVSGVESQTSGAEPARGARHASAKSIVAEGTPASSRRRPQVGTVGSTSFQGLLFTQWLTMINDNTFRWLVVGIGKNLLPNQAGVVLAAGLACFVLPYLLLASISGYLADRFSKRNVIICCKVAEVIIMALGLWAIYLGSFAFLLVVVTLMGAQSALFAPAKRGAIPEILTPDQIAKANGWFGFSTVTATVIGMMLGNWLADYTAPYGQQHLAVSGAVLIGVAIVGTIISVWIAQLDSANPGQPFPWNTFSKTIRDLVNLYRHRALFFVACGIVLFWSLAALAQLNIDQFANESGAFRQTERNPLLLSLVMGVAIGSILAGIWSGGRIELGMLSMASAGIAFFSLLLFTVGEEMFHQENLVTGPLVWSCSLLLLLGISAGIFDIPLSSYIQYRSPVANRGAILSAVNFLVFTGILLAAPFFALLRLPYHPGSLENIPRDLLARSLSEQQQFEVERRVLQLTRDWTEAYPELRVGSAAAADRGNGSERRATQVAFHAWQEPEAAMLDEPSAADGDTAAAGEKEEDAAHEPPPFADYLEGAPAGIREWLLARLLWTELSYRQELDRQRSKDSYLRLCERHPALDREDRELVKAVFEQSSRLPLFSARQIFLIIGLLAMPICLIVTWKLPQASARFMIWWGCQTWFRVRVRGLSEIPERTPVVFLVNHDSAFHRLLILLVTARKIRLVTWRPLAPHPWRRAWDRFWGVIHITGGPATQQEAIVEARKTLRRGNLLAVFPEPTSQVSGRETEPYPGELLGLLEGLKVPLQPVTMSPLKWWSEPARNGWLQPPLRIIRHVRAAIEIRFESPHDKPTQPSTRSETQP